MNTDLIASLAGIVAGLAFIALASVAGSYLRAGRRIDAGRIARATRRPLDGRTAGVVNRIGDN